jgi:hypothetical protein
MTIPDRRRLYETAIELQNTNEEIRDLLAEALDHLRRIGDPLAYHLVVSTEMGALSPDAVEANEVGWWTLIDGLSAPD